MSIWLIAAAVLEYATLAILFFLSVWSFSIVIDRQRSLRSLTDTKQVDLLRSLIEGARWQELAVTVNEKLDRSLDLSTGAIRAALNGPQNRQAVDHSVQAYLTKEQLKLESGLSVLATLGSNAPFIGLFGTVLGIIQAFAVLGNQQGEAASVMTGISRALFATAAGLFVAIPAVIAFNYFINRVRRAISETQSLKDLYLARMTERS